MAKQAKQRYVLNLKLETEKFQEDILNKRFEIGRQLYNSVLGKALNIYNEMTKTKRWRENQANMSEIYKVEKDKKKAKKLLKGYYDIRKDMLKEFRRNSSDKALKKFNIFNYQIHCIHLPFPYIKIY